MLILFSFYSYNVTGSFERNFVGYWSVALQYMTIYWFLVRSWGRKFVDKDTNGKKNNLKKMLNTCILLALYSLVAHLC